MRVINAGGYVLEPAKTVAAVTQANPCKVTTGASHGFATGDRLWLSGLGGMTALNGRFVDITVTRATEFTVGIDTSGFAAFTSGGTAARVYTLATPYGVADLAALKYEQSADTMTLTHKNYAPRKLTRAGHAAWTLSLITFAPSQQPPTGVSSSSAGTAQYYAVTAINDDSGEESLQSADAGSRTETSTLTCTPLTGCTSYSVYKRKNGVYGFIGTASVFQLVFWIIGGDPSRYRALMPVTVLEKLVFGVPVALLYAQGRAPAFLLPFGVIDLMLGLGFFLAWRATPRS